MGEASPMDLLVSYSWHHFHQASREAIHILQRFGDPHPQVDKTAVWGIAVAHTCLDNRAVTAHCRELHAAEPEAFQWTVKWLPVDYWCETDLDAMKKLIDYQIKIRLATEATWAMQVQKRRWQKYHSIEIVEYLAAAIDNKVDLDNPDYIIWVDVIGRDTAISLLRPDDIFSLNLPHL